MVRVVGTTWPYRTSAITFGVACLVSVANGQSTSPNQRTTKGAELETVVVTAQRREENIQDVPIAVVALRPDDLASRQIETTEQLRLVVPSLVYNSPGGFGQPYLRGIGNNQTGPNLDPEVATYQDGIYISNQSSAILQMLATERVEVLAGPQGTLYGRNANAGAINYITRTPGDELAGKLQVGYGNYDRLEGSAYIEAPLSDHLAVGLYGGASRQDPWYTLLIPPDQRTRNGTDDEESDYAIRGKVRFDNDTNLKMVLTGEYTKNSGYDFSVQPPSPRALAFTVRGEPFIGERFVSAAGDEVSRDAETVLTSLDVALDFGPVTLTSLTGFRSTRVEAYMDLDGSAQPVMWFGARLGSDTYSQEFRVSSNGDGRLDWIAGLYGFKEESFYGSQDIGSDVLFAAVAPGFVVLRTNSTVETEAWAAFGQLTYSITDELRLTLGGRYTHEYKDLVDVSRRFARLVDGEIGPPVFSVPPFPDASDDWGNFSARVGLDYSLGDTLLYATYSEGFKSGAFTPTTTLIPAVEPETLTAYEIGTKGDYLNGLLRFNTAAYYYKLENAQVDSFSDAGIEQLENAAEAEAYGLEMTAGLRFASGFALDVSTTLGHAEYTDYRNGGGWVPVATGYQRIAVPDLSGGDLPGAPSLVVSASPSYVTQLPGGGELSLIANYYYNSGYAFEAQGLLEQDAYDVVNLSGRYTFPNRDVSIELYGQNVGDTAYLTTFTVTPVAPFIKYAPPRTYGIRAWYDF